MYKKGIGVWVMVFLLIVSMMAVGCGGKTETAAPAEKVKVGVILPLTGGMSQLGGEVFNGYNLAMEMINAKGGVWGKQVELVKGDAPDATTATSEANRLITREGVKVICGSYASAISYAASEVSDRNKVIYWEQGAVADNVTDRHLKYFFRLIYKASDQGRGTAEFVANEIAPRLGKDPKDLKIAVMNEDSNFGTGITIGVKAVAEETGMNIVVHEQYNSQTTDLSSVVLKMKQAKPDVVIATSYVPDAVLFWRQAKEAGFSPAVMIGNGGGHNMPDFAEALGDDVNGVFNCAASSTFNVDGLLPEAKALFLEFQKNYQNKYGKLPSAHAAMGFNAMYLLLTEVLPPAGEMDVEKIKAVAQSLDKPKGSTIVGWGVKFDSDGQNTRGFTITDQWQGQKLVSVYPAEFSMTDKVTVPLPEWGKRADVGK